MIGQLSGRRVLLLSLCVLLLLVIFAFDLMVPLGIAAGVPYVLPVLVATWLPWRRSVWAVGTIATLLVLVGYGFSEFRLGVVEEDWVVAANRLLALSAIWATAVLSVLWLRSIAAQQREHARLRAVMDTCADAIVTIDESGRIQSFSKAGEHLFGYSEAEVVGRNVSVLMPSPHAENHQGYLARYLKTGEPRVIGRGREVDAVRKDGTEFPVHLMVGEVVEEDQRLFTGFVHDLTRRRRAEQIAEVERHLSTTVLETTDALVAILDRDGRIVRLNRAFQRLVGFPGEQVVGHDIGFIMPDEARRTFEASVRAVISGHRPMRFQGALLTRDGEQRVITWSNSVILDENDAVGFVVTTGIDVTEEKAAEERIRSLQQDLYRIGRVSELGGMASAIAHELNQPLTAISNFVAAAQRMLEQPGEAARSRAGDMMQRAVEQAERAAEIIRRLRQLIGGRRARMELHDLNEVVEDAAALALIGASEKGVIARLDLADELPKVWMSRTQIQQVAFNLIRNAIEAMEAQDGERRLQVATRRRTAGAIEVMIADSGPGLDPEVQEKLFMPFITTKEDGIGIGLSISRLIIDAHDGQIWAQPGSDGGAEFHFSLPVDVEAAAEEPPDDEQRSEERDSHLHH